MKWYYVTVTLGSYTYKGYIRSDMMEQITASDFGDDSNSGEQETIGMIKVTGNASLRYQPSTSANRVGTANVGDCFYYVDTVDGWFQTKSGYWISRDYAAVSATDAEVEAYIKNNGGSGDTGTSFTLGSTGSTVSYIQTALTALDYYDREVTGHYGKYTRDAVREFQRDHNLTADGVCGPATLAAIRTDVLPGSSSATTDYQADGLQARLELYEGQCDGAWHCQGFVHQADGSDDRQVAERPRSVHRQPHRRRAADFCGYDGDAVRNLRCVLAEFHQLQAPPDDDYDERGSVPLLDLRSAPRRTGYHQ